MKVWVFIGESESGDRFGPAVYDYPVTREEINTYLYANVPDEEVTFGIWEEEVNTKPK
jgi:uncharacterized protein (DUF433 family)